MHAEKTTRQIARFSLTGVIATAVDFAVMVFAHEVLGVNAVVSACVSYMVSLVLNYAMSMTWVFKGREDISRTREFLIFLLLSLVGLGLNQLIMMIGERVVEFGGMSFQEGYTYVLVKVFATLLVMTWNFLSRKRWLERRPPDANAS